MFSGKTGRRQFLVRVLEMVLLVFSSFWRRPTPSLAETLTDRGKWRSAKVVSVHHPEASAAGKGYDNADVDADAARAMVNAGIMAFTGESELECAWRKIIPDPTKKVAIKVNCQLQGIYTKAKVVQPIVEGLLACRVQSSNIVIYDMTDKAFDLAGFARNLGPGVKVGTVKDFGGYGRFLFHRLANLLTGGYESEWINFIAKLQRESRVALVRFLAGLLLADRKRPWDCTYIINVPVLKALDGYSGVSLSMKNHYGSFANPSEHHEDIMSYIPLINSLPEIREKTRLIVLDAIFGEYLWINGREQSHVVRVNKLLISTDPIAIDTIGWRMIDELRKQYGVGPVTPEPVFIARAASMGLGIADPSEIQHKHLEL